jgi:formiminotetrahydrofolate cyclodeaminase
VAGYLTTRVDNLLSAFGAGNAVPGSGSAAALMGMLAASLARTAALKSREHMPGSAGRFDFLIGQLDRSVEKLKDHFEQDSVLFREVVELRLQRDREIDRAASAVLARKANDKLVATAELIASIAEECLGVAENAVAIFKEGWPAVRGDSGAAISSALAGAMSCVFVSRVNARTLGKRDASARIHADAERIGGRIETLQETVWECAAVIIAAAEPDRPLPLK